MRNFLNKKIFLIFITALLLPCASKAQIDKISGYVVDSMDDEPICYAEIRLKNINKIAFSDTSGYFVLDSVFSDKYTLTVNHIGYQGCEIEINNDTLYNDLTIRLRSRIWQYAECGDSIIVHTTRMFEPSIARAVPNPYKKVDLPMLVVKDKNVECPLDSVIAYMKGKSNRRYYMLRFEESTDKDKLMIISFIYTPYNLNSVPNGILKYNGNYFYVYGDYQGILRKEKKCGKENKETLVIDLSQEHHRISNTIYWYFKYSKRGFEIIKNR